MLFRRNTQASPPLNLHHRSSAAEYNHRSLMNHSVMRGKKKIRARFVVVVLTFDLQPLTSRISTQGWCQRPKSELQLRAIFRHHHLKLGGTGRSLWWWPLTSDTENSHRLKWKHGVHNALLPKSARSYKHSPTRKQREAAEWPLTFY